MAIPTHQEYGSADPNLCQMLRWDNLDPNISPTMIMDLTTVRCGTRPPFCNV